MPGILGIDPGVTGALALYRLESREPPWLVVDLPASTATLMWWINRWSPAACYLERTFRNEKLVEHTGWIRGVVEACHVPVVRVAAITWKSHFGLLRKDKRASLQLARKYAGDIPELKLQKHHNRAEAILIAAYGVDKYGGLI